MKRSLPAYCYRKGKKGYVYFCRDKRTQRMFTSPGTAEFAAEYAKLMRGISPTPNRTIKGLIWRYKESEKYADLSVNTKKSYDRHLKYLETAIGNVDPSTIRTVHVYTMRDELRDKPTDANRKIGVLSTLLAYGKRIGWVNENVAEGTEKLDGVKPEREPWPEDKIKAFRAEAYPLPRLIFELCLGTGQRIGDVLKMRWTDIEDGGVNVKQDKTGTSLFVPFTDALAAIIEKTPRLGETIAAQPNGRSCSYSYAHKLITDVRDKIGAMRWDIHSLRHSAAAEIASLPGMSMQHVMAITGHSSEQMARHYSRKADMRAKAKEAQNARRTKKERGNDN